MVRLEYLDYNSTTPVKEEVLDAMIPYFVEYYGNPSSRTHKFGQDAEKAIFESRKKTSQILNCSPEEIFFTSGATESNNIALLGVMREKAQKGFNHLITSSIEHKSILEPANQLEKEGINVTYIRPEKNGVLDVNKIANAITDKTGLISIQYVNNEIGTIQPISDIARITKEKNVLFHCDAAQAVGKISIDLTKVHVDLLSFSGHKFFGPKGIGCLYIREYLPKIKIQPIAFGGGQEYGISPGTVPVPLVIGMGKALEMSMKEADSLRKIQVKERDLFLKKLKESDINFTINGDLQKRLPNNLSIHLHGQDAEALMLRLKDNVAISSGSACTSESYDGSYVLKELGLSEYEARCSIRIGFYKNLLNKISIPLTQ